MALQLSVAVRNAQADQIEVITGASAKVQIRTGAPPANCAAAASGTLLAEIAVAADWLTNAANGVKTLNGTPSVAAAAAGTAAHFRLVDNAGTTCHAQGTVTATGGGGDMTVDNVSIAAAQTVTLQTFSYTRGNA